MASYHRRLELTSHLIMKLITQSSISYEAKYAVPVGIRCTHVLDDSSVSHHPGGRNGAEEVQSIIHIKAEKCKNMKHSQDMQLIQKLRDDQKCMKKVFEVMSGRNIVTNSRVTPSWREIVSLTFSEAGVLHAFDQKFDAFSGECFSEYIRQLISSLDKVEFNNLIFNVFLDKMVSDSNVFCPICAQQPDKETYSALVVEIAVHFCFLDHHLTSFLPRNCALPDVLFLESWQPTWSASAKALVQPMQQSIAYEVPVISTAEENISTAGRTVTYRIRSEEERTRKDKENNNDRALSPEESKN
ncbi:hypothetical protein Tco_0820046 [Tanacetum coccineum]|uniref:Uncharacterized protein n=1 Tax=Tanacetum coccineum TaxID=301880 RepID=A0ABQ5AAX0_9ASTR